MSSDGGQPLVVKPRLSEEAAAKLLLDLYGLKVKTVKPMCSYDDLNFHFTVETDHINPHLSDVSCLGYTMKVVNSFDTGQPGLIESFQEALFHLKSRGLEVPVPVSNLSGQFCQRIRLNAQDEIKNGNPVDDGELFFAVHLLTYLAGSPLSSVQYTPEVLRSVGQTLARVLQAFQGFSNGVLEKRAMLWSLWSVPQLEKYVFAVKDADRRALVQGVIRNFTENVIPTIKNFPQVVMHGDLNEHNLLVSSEREGGPLRVSGVLDLGDVQSGPRLFEVAVCLVYSTLGGPERLGDMDPLMAPGHVLRGVAQSVRLTDQETTLLKACMEARLAQSLTLGAHTHHLNPDNEYVLDSARHGWTVLRRLVDSDTQDLLQKWEQL